MAIDEVRPRLRVGVVLESTRVPAWQLSILQSLHASNVAEVSLVLLIDRPDDSGQFAFHRLSLSLLLWLFPQSRPGGADACAPVLVTDVLNGVPRVEAGLALEAKDVAERAIRSGNLDLLVSLAPRRICEQWSALVPLGLWFLEVNGKDLSASTGTFVGLEELLGRKSCLSTRLRILTSPDTVGLVAYDTHSAVDYMSFVTTRNQHLWKCAAFPSRVLSACDRAGRDIFLHGLPTLPARTRMFAGLSLIANFVSYVAWRLFLKLSRLIFSERWMLMSGSQRTHEEPVTFKVRTPPVGRFWADPHVAVVDGVRVVFFEDASLETGLGRISVADVSDDGAVSRPRTVLEKPYHLSYPFVFEWKDQLYLVPESGANRTVELYQCTGFPDEWAFSHNLIEGLSAYDATLFEHQDTWWMFANVRETEGCSTWDELHLFWADSPISKRWTPHAGNPVISDVRRARPGGPLFVEHGRLLRPSQDSSGRYGRALNINEVLELNKDAYRESPVRRLRPGFDRKMRAIHTLSHAAQVTFIDAVIRERRRNRATAAR